MTAPLRIVATSRPTALSRELVRGHLHLAVAQEVDGTYVMSTEADLESSGLDADTTWNLAMSMLRQTTSRSDLRPVDTLPGLMILLSDDGLAASRMVLLPDLIGSAALGGMVVAVPSPDQLLCVPLGSARALDALQVMASALGHALEVLEQPLSDQLFWYDGNRWLPLTVIHGEDEVTVMPPPGFVRTMNRLAAMDLVRVAGEA